MDYGILTINYSMDFGRRVYPYGSSYYGRIWNNEYGITEYYLNMEEYEIIIEYYTLWIQQYQPYLRKYDWGMMTRLAVPSQTVAMDP